MELTQTEQEEILSECAELASCPHYSPARAYLDIRAGLRLDDPKLNGIIQVARDAGLPLPWSSERVPA